LFGGCDLASGLLAGTAGTLPHPVGLDDLGAVGFTLAAVEHIFVQPDPHEVVNCQTANRLDEAEQHDGPLDIVWDQLAIPAHSIFD
jgi:hypothetical protein